jgi:hypothetical protein
MPQIANSAVSVEALQAAITMLSKLECRWRKTGRKRALYKFLQTVLDFYATWKRTGGTRKAANRIARLAGLRRQPGRHSLRILIDVGSTADRKQKAVGVGL